MGTRTVTNARSASYALIYPHLARTGATLWVQDTLSMVDVMLPFAERGSTLSMSSAPWLHSAQIGVKELLLLDEDWNGEGALQVAQSAVVTAGQLVADLAIFESLPAPAVYATNDGGVVIDWQVDGRHVDLEVPPAGDIELFYSMPEHGTWDGTIEATPVPLEDLLGSLA